MNPAPHHQQQHHHHLRQWCSSGDTPLAIGRTGLSPIHWLGSPTPHPTPTGLVKVKEGAEGSIVRADTRTSDDGVGSLPILWYCGRGQIARRSGGLCVQSRGIPQGCRQSPEPCSQSPPRPPPSPPQALNASRDGRDGSGWESELNLFPSEMTEEKTEHV